MNIPVIQRPFSTTATGLTYMSSTGVLSLTSGYVIPTTTEESAWNAKADYSFGANNFSGTGTIGAGAITGTSLKIPQIGGTAGKYSIFRGGANIADLTYTLPTAYPASAAFLKSSAAGVLSFDTNTYITFESDPVAGSDVLAGPFSTAPVFRLKTDP